MADSFGTDDPLLAIARRLFPLIRGRMEWWREAVRRWASNPPLHGDNRCALPIPFPPDVKLARDERLALLAAIHDTYATADARIAPWPNVWELSSKAEIDMAMRWGGLLNRVAKELPKHWDTHEAAIEIFIAQAEEELAGQCERAEQTRSGSEAAETASEPFVLTPLQVAILDALNGQALKKGQLAAKVCGGDGSRLYKPGALTELRERGKVAHKHGVGFYRPDAPPPTSL